MRLCLAPAILAASLIVGPVSAQDMTPEQVKELALEAILENPEIIMEAVAIIQAREAEEAAAASAEVLTSERDLLENDPNAPVAGNPEGDVVIVEFFDYNCPYCRRAGKEVEALIEADPNVKLVYREWPILGEGSVVASRAALAAREQGKYEVFHHALMALEGRVNEQKVMQVAAEMGLDLDKLKADMQLPAIDQHIQTTMDLTRKLGFNGTPSFVVGENTVPGFVERDALEELVQKAREGS